MDTAADIAILHARFTKASRLADLLDGEGCTFTDVRYMDDRDWSIAAKAAQVKIPSEVTRALTVMLLENREERKHRG